MIVQNCRHMWNYALNSCSRGGDHLYVTLTIFSKFKHPNINKQHIKHFRVPDVKFIAYIRFYILMCRPCFVVTSYGISDTHEAF